MFRFFKHISPSEYWFSGQFTTPETSGAPKPLAATGSFLNDGGQVVFEGGFRFAAGNISHPFTLRVLANLAHASVIEIRSAVTGTLSGYLYSIGASYELLATSEKGSAVAAHIELVGTDELRLGGSVTCPEHSISFMAHGSPGADREGFGNVVFILGGQRA